MAPFEFLLLAERLLRNEPHPAGFRSAVSRAYYAAHHCLKDFIESGGVSIDRGANAHADVWNHLADIGDAEIERVGSDLFNLHSERIGADYRLTRRNVESLASASILVAQARELIDVVGKCRSNTARFQKIKHAIKIRHAVLRGMRR
jgi:uncharacterized protein (UPF0332 family)